MLRSLLSAVTGLDSHQTFMDVISNNIANVNTDGFKASRMSFQDILNQTMSGGTAPTINRGGTNPIQVGLGVQVGGIQTIQTQGDLQPTGKVTDLAIRGDGFFIVNDGTTNHYTRAGSFDVGADGFLANLATGQRVQGWVPNVLTGGVLQTDANGQFLIDNTQPAGDIHIPLNAVAPPKTTGTATLVGNLDSGAVVGTTGAVQATTVVYDSLGRSHNIGLTFTKTALGAWSVAAQTNGDPSITVAPSLTPPNLTFNSSGALTSGSALAMSVTYNDITPATQLVNLNISGVTQLSSGSQVNLQSQDGYGAGSLLSFSIGQDGTIRGVFSNGANQLLGQVALARFSNPSGLVRDGQTNFDVGVNSGLPVVGAAGQGGLGSVASGQLEMSNVDLARQFSDMIVAERGLQANSRMVTTSDQILQDLISMKQAP